MAKKEEKQEKKEVAKKAANQQTQQRRPQNRRGPRVKTREEIMEEWKPKTSLGKLTKAGTISSINEALDSPLPLLEPEIVDLLLSNLKSELLLIGQIPGKFGGGKRRAFRQTQRKTKEGNAMSFSTMAVIGNENGYVGLGVGKSKETIPAREKAIRHAKLNVIKIRRGCISWETDKEPHTIPFAVSGKCGSVEIELIPAPKGTGLVVEKECQKILALAGIKDCWSRTKGRTVVKMNLVKACIKALENLSKMKIQPEHNATLGIVEGLAGAQE